MQDYAQHYTRLRTALHETTHRTTHKTARHYARLYAQFLTRPHKTPQGCLRPHLSSITGDQPCLLLCAQPVDLGVVSGEGQYQNECKSTVSRWPRILHDEEVDSSPLRWKAFCRQLQATDGLKHAQLTRIAQRGNGIGDQLSTTLVNLPSGFA